MIENVRTADIPRARRVTVAPVLRIHEDWLAVILGVTVLTLALLGLVPAMPGLKWDGAASLWSLFTPGVLGGWIAAGIGVGVLSAVALTLEGNVDLARYTRGFPLLFGLAWLSMVAAGQRQSIAFGIEYVIYALALGLLVSHLGGASTSIRAAARSELFIKTGLVIMGATILFSDVVAAGALGILQAIGVVIVVWYAAFWLAKRLRVDEELAVMLSTAVSICGVSAAIAACGAIQGDRRKLSYITTLVLVVAVPMIILMPWIVRLAGIPDAVAGAWMGGTLDTTGSVTAAGALVSETTMKIGTIVKFSQNVLIGVAAVALSTWWAMRHSTGQETQSGIAVMWQRFPKFVLGFVAASLVFSFLLSPRLVEETKAAIGSVRTIWFALAFVAIGLEARVSDLLTFDSGRPLVAFVAAQAFNVAWTLVLAWLIFGGIVFPTITI
jgi:uncharacterized membrane protein YadS